MSQKPYAFTLMVTFCDPENERRTHFEYNQVRQGVEADRD